SIDDFVQEIVTGQRTGRYSPLRVAEWLDRRADAAERHLAEATALVNDDSDPAWRRLSTDVLIAIAVGRFWASKLRAGVGYSLYTATKDTARLQEGVNAYRLARASWQRAAEYGRVYRDDLTFGEHPYLR